MYGVDECRVCGVPIRVPGPTARAEQEKANRKPPMPEKEWRRRGYLCPPTRHQLIEPQHGCCPQCGREQAIKKYNPNTRLVLMLGMIAAFFVLTVFFVYGNDIYGKLGGH
jgi:hypothetical protein